MPPLQHALKRELALVQKRNKFRVQWTPFPVRFTGKFAQQQIVCRAGAAKQRPLLRAQARKRGGKRRRVPPKTVPPCTLPSARAARRLRHRSTKGQAAQTAARELPPTPPLFPARSWKDTTYRRSRGKAPPGSKRAQGAHGESKAPQCSSLSPPFFPSISYLTGKENPHFLARRRRTRSPACFFHRSPAAFATQSKSGKCLAFLTKNDIIIIALFGCFTREIYEIQRRISQCPSI